MLCMSYVYKNDRKRSNISEYSIDISEGIDVNKTSASKKCNICHF